MVLVPGTSNYVVDQSVRGRSFLVFVRSLQLPLLVQVLILYKYRTHQKLPEHSLEAQCHAVVHLENEHNRLYPVQTLD